MHQCLCFKSNTSALRGGGHCPRKGVWGCAALKTPFHVSPVVRKGPISSKRVSSQAPLLRKFGNFSLYSLNFYQNFSSQAPKFGNFQLSSPQIWKFSAHKPPNLEIFRSQAPFSEASISSQAPHFGNPDCTPLPEKKLSAPPPGSALHKCQIGFATQASFSFQNDHSVNRFYLST